MSHWNYRVVRFEAADECSFQIHEVYYEADDATVRAWSERAIPPHGVTWEELIADYTRQADAFTKPVLWAETLPGGDGLPGDDGLPGGPA